MLYETGKLIKASPLTSQAFPEFGTSVIMNLVNEIGALSTRNFQDSLFENADKISGEALADTILVKNQACWACPITCTRISKTEAGGGEGPEFETAWSFGAQCGVDDLEAIFEANMICNDMGLDTISVGNTIGCAMEMAERGLIDSDLRFGRADLLKDTVLDIALAVIHCHPRTAIALSLSRDEIIPIDNEGSYFLRKIPVVSVEFASGSRQMAETVAETLQGYKIIMQRGHGCFSIGETLEDAYQWVFALEEVCDIILRHTLLGEPLIEYRKHSESYSKC